MKKASIVIIIVAMSMIVVGATIAAISFAQGAKYHGFFNRNGKVETNKYTDFADITDINIDLGAASLDIKQGEEFKVVINSTSKQSFEVEEIDGTLNIKETNNSSNWLFGLNIGNDISSIEVYVPSGYEADSITVDAGASHIIIDSIVSKSTNLEIGAGKIEVRNIETENLSIEVGAGQVNVDGVVQGNINIECSVGAVNLDLEGNEDDYRVQGSVSVGTFKFNDNSYGGVFDSSFNFGDGDYKIIVDCDAGSIKINIK